MFHNQYRFYSNLLLVADGISGLIALIVSYYLRYHLVDFSPFWVERYFSPKLLPSSDYFFYFMVFSPLWIVLLRITQDYSGVMRLPMRLQAARVLKFVVATGFLMGFFSYSFKLIVSRPVFFAFLASTGFILVFNRVILYWVLRRRNVNEYSQIKILLVGTDEHAHRVGQQLERFKIWGYHVIGYLRHLEGPDGFPGMEVLGSLRDLPQLLETGLVVDEIIFIGTHKENLGSFEELIQLCEDLGIRTRVAGDFFPTSIAKVSLEFLENLPLITFSTSPEHGMAIVAKRVVDFAVAVTLLVLLAPLMLLTLMMIKFTSPGTVLYRQTRCGLYGRQFTLFKFRTMVEGAEDKLWEIKHLNEMSGPVFKMRDDPRVTSLGRFLRKFSIDELPQLWNVIKGEMSIVGPRAPLLEEVRYYSTKQRRRLSVKPGITCLWQISGRSEIDFQQWMELDLRYIDHWSFWLDIQIILRTIPAVLAARGAR